MLHMSSLRSVFPVTCARLRSRVAYYGVGVLVFCSGIVSRWLRRTNDWSSWNGHSSRPGVHCKQRTSGLRLWNQRQVPQQHQLRQQLRLPRWSTCVCLGNPLILLETKRRGRAGASSCCPLSAAVSPELRALMGKARTTADDMRNLTLAEQVCSRQLCYTLSLSTSGEAQRRLQNAPEGVERENSSVEPILSFGGVCRFTTNFRNCRKKIRDVRKCRK